jgi:hypothetical protein
MKERSVIAAASYKYHVELDKISKPYKAVLAAKKLYPGLPEWSR